MKISTKGRYAIRMMLDLAMHAEEEYIPLNDIAERQGISKKYLEQIVPVLNSAGFLKTNRGYRGGYMLRKAPECYTAGEILRCTEGSLAPVLCAEQSPPDCPRAQGCMTLPLWRGLYKAVEDYLDSVTLRDLIAEYTERGANDYVI